MERSIRLKSSDWNRTYNSGVDYTPLTDDSMDKLVNYLPDGSGKVAIDLGSGTGQIARGLKDRGFSVTGLDLSFEAVKKARNQSEPMDIHYEVADFETDFSSKFDPADLVITKYVYAFIKDREKFLQNVINLLRPDGRFVVINPLKSAVPENKKYIALETQQIVNELEVGFDLVDYYIDGRVEYFVYKRSD